MICSKSTHPAYKEKVKEKEKEKEGEGEKENERPRKYGSMREIKHGKKYEINNELKKKISERRNTTTVQLKLKITVLK